MALIKYMELDSGIILEHAYLKVENIYCNNDKIRFSLSTYKDKTARDSEKSNISSTEYVCLHDTTENSKNSIKQAYEYLKTLDEYIGAIDDLE